MVAAARARRPRIDAAAGLRTARELRDALSASERLLRQTLEATRTGSWSWDVRTNVIQWSDNLGPIHGLPRGAQPESFQGLLELLHPDDRQRLVDAVEACLHEGRGYEIELRTAPRDGDVRWIWASASAMDLEDGRPRRIVGLARDITTRKRAETATAHADSLQQVTAGLSAAATVGEIADVVIDQGIPALSASTGILGVVEPPDGLRFVRSVGYGDVFPDRLRLSDPWPITDAIRQRRVIELRDVPDRRAVYDVPERVWEASGQGALVAVPLVVRDRVVGALGFTRDDAAALTADERSLVETLAGQAAQALERASLAEADRRARVRAEALQRVATAIATAVSVEDVADAVAEEALELHDASGVTVILVRPDDPATARVLASRGMVAAHATSEPTVDLGLGTLTAASIGSATALYAESVEQLEAEWPASARVARALGVGAVACVPFRVGERSGALSVVLAEPRPFGPEERTFLELLATACQQGLERASLYEAERTARTRADSLHELSSALSGALSPEDVGRAFLDHALGLVSGGTGALMLADAENRMLVRAAIGGSGTTRGLWLPSVPVDGAFVIATAYRRQEPVAAATRAELEERFPGTAANFGEHARAAYARPLVVEGRAIGAFGLIFEHEEELTADDERLLATMARLCAQAYERAQLYEREHRIALRLQQALLPEEVVSHPAVAIATRYQAGSELMEVGGDWYDTFALEDGRVGVAVGDVVGRGIEAAASMGRLRSAMAALAFEGTTPGDLITRLGRFAAGPGQVEFATTCYAALEPATGVLRYASAGHPPLLVATPSGESRWLDGGRTGPLVSFPTEHETAEAAAVLEPGSLVLLFSDGLVERRGELLEHGLARLARVARDSVDLPVETVCDRVLGELGVPSHGDDVVLVVLRTAVTAQPVFRHAFPARPEELRIARDAARNWLEQHGVLGRRAHDVVLALGEACANAVEHAYRGGTGEVEVEISGTAADLLLSVRDRGRWRVPAADGDRGRGTSIMQALASELRVDTTEGGTTVTIRFHEPKAVTA